MTMSGRRFARWLTAILNRIDPAVLAGHFAGLVFVYQCDPSSYGPAGPCDHVALTAYERREWQLLVRQLMHRPQNDLPVHDL
jgi:hypothetical protein